MGKTDRIRQVVDNTRSPEREALRSAIANHAKLRAAIDENVAAQRRAEDAKLDAINAGEKAQKQLEEAKVADAHALAYGDPGGAVKAARAALQEHEDTVAAARAATSLLADEAADLVSRADMAASQVNARAGAVVRADGATRRLISELREAQLNYHHAREAMRALSFALPPIQNATAWAASGLEELRNWDADNWEQNLPPSPIAAKVRQWIEALRQDPDARLEIE
jgi:hypothetical protein